MEEIYRLTIFCFYESDEYVYKYVYNLLGELVKVSNKLIIVVNASVNNEGKEGFKKYTDNVIYRENKGYDAMAYRTVIQMIGAEELKKYDEVLLCNNTFFGPFLSLKAIFQKFEHIKCDFWGLSFQNLNLVKFIESYFIVFRANIVKTGELWNFFDNMHDILEYRDALIYFEQGIFWYFEKRGYLYDALIKKEKYYSNREFPLEVIVYEGLPIIKKRAFMHENMNINKISAALVYINANYNYDIDLIIDWMKRNGINIQVDIDKEVNSYLEPLPFVNLPNKTIEEVNVFINGKKKIYIYGNGYYRHIFSDLYQIQMEGIIVSDGQIITDKDRQENNVYYYSQIDLEQDGLGVIVALNKRNTNHVRENIGEKENMLYLW